jgi:hypothetical protein
MATKVKATVRQKREQAIDRQKAHDSLTLENKLKKLDSVPGEAKRERARLTKQIAEAKKEKKS